MNDVSTSFSVDLSNLVDKAKEEMTLTMSSHLVESTLFYALNFDGHEQIASVDLTPLIETAIEGSGEIVNDGGDLNLTLNVNGVEEQIVVDLDPLVETVVTQTKSIVAIQATAANIGGEIRRRKLSSPNKGSKTQAYQRPSMRALKGDDKTEIFVGGYTEETVDGFVVIKEGHIVGLSGLLSEAIENDDSIELDEDQGTLKVGVTVTSQLTTETHGSMLVLEPGMKSQHVDLSADDANKISVSPGDVVTFVIGQVNDVLPEKNSINLVLYLEQ